MNTYLLDEDFHLGGKFQKAHHLNVVKKNELESRFSGMISHQSLWLTRGDSFQSHLRHSVFSQRIYREQSFLKRYSNLIILGSIEESLKSKLALIFKKLIIAREETSLPVTEMIEVLSSDAPEKYVISVEADDKNETLILVRGCLEKLVVPFSVFQKSGDGTAPDFKKLGVTDHGQTVSLGDYEASVESLLYEFDPAFRKQLKKERRKSEKTLGACIRRLRLQKGLKQTDFPDIDEKEIGRIERGEVTKPHQTTLETIATRLGIKADDILGY